jgi:hypothetical protein
MAWAETFFDTLYLLIVVTSGVLLCLGSLPKGGEGSRFGIMALILGAGDAFHLVPRILFHHSGGRRDYRAALGYGKLVASITMTLFYLLLWSIGRSRYPALAWGRYDIPVLVLAIGRIVFCLLPQNRWAAEAPPRRWSLYRNMPFFGLGFIVAAAYGFAAYHTGDVLSFVWLAVAVSFACYIPVVLFGDKHPKLGMLMLPKSCAYAAIVLMGFGLT